MTQNAQRLPEPDVMGSATRAIEAASIAAAGALPVAVGARLAADGLVRWWLPLALAASGLFAARAARAM